jgi:hypothetical protein
MKEIEIEIEIERGRGGERERERKSISFIERRTRNRGVLPPSMSL